ncbi:hypothetical protein WJX82_007766 [Trebouxia sp. C0006]
MARTERALRCLRVLSRSVLCNDTLPAVDSAHVFSAAPARLQTLAEAGDCQDSQQAFATTSSCSSSGAQQLLGSSFAALSLQQSRLPTPLSSVVQLSAQQQPDQAVVIHWVDGNDFQKAPRSIGSIAKYGDEDINLTERIILTPTREADKLISPPAVNVPLRADSVRRKRKHKMNKHKHKKRRKLQRHKN